MKIAARFPVTGYSPLLYGYWAVHLGLLVIALVEFGLVWLQTLVIGALIISIYFSLKHYQKITQASDDLCWNGSSWLMQGGGSFQSPPKSPLQSKFLIYLTVQPNSWLTSYLSLLHFDCDNKKYTWLFTKAELGERAYSHLVYLVKQNLKQDLKQDLNQLD